MKTEVTVLASKVNIPDFFQLIMKRAPERLLWVNFVEFSGVRLDSALSLPDEVWTNPDQVY